MISSPETVKLNFLMYFFVQVLVAYEYAYASRVNHNLIKVITLMHLTFSVIKSKPQNKKLN